MKREIKILTSTTFLIMISLHAMQNGVYISGMGEKGVQKT